MTETANPRDGGGLRGSPVRVLLPLLLLCGCSMVDLRSEQPDVSRFALDYEPPSPAGARLPGVTVGVRDFHCSGAYATDCMVLVRAGEGLQTVTSLNRWSQQPGYTVPDLLSRDMVEAGFLEGVYRGLPGAVDYTVDGAIREFGGREMAGVWYAVIDLDLAFTRDRSGGSGEVFATWRTYRFETALDGDGFGSLAEAMSRTMRDVSAAVLEDLADWMASDPGAAPPR
ncbi:membrane integrity-associated transporter subunit PqiC [Candidatus Fermentibacterales bacterium]|nr:membrane integrity-associated transporter subunit PqiC [Candidatus Fermentibacterales bacterium]